MPTEYQPTSETATKFQAAIYYLFTLAAIVIFSVLDRRSTYMDIKHLENNGAKQFQALYDASYSGEALDVDIALDVVTAYFKAVEAKEKEFEARFPYRPTHYITEGIIGCPFCGAKELDGEDDNSLWCHQCKAQSPWNYRIPTLENTLKLWNTRVSLTPENEAPLDPPTACVDDPCFQMDEEHPELGYITKPHPDNAISTHPDDSEVWPEPKCTMEEFILYYCCQSNIPWATLQQMKRVVRCNCDYSGCKGWAMVYIDAELKHDQKEVDLDVSRIAKEH